MLPRFAPVQSFYPEALPPATPLRQIQAAERVYSSSRKAISKRNTHSKKSSAEKRDIREKQRVRMWELRVATGFTPRAASIRERDSDRHREVYNAKLLAERNAAVYSDEELADIDNKYQFGLQSSVKDLYTKCAQRLSFASMTKHCCIVCDCNYTKNELTYSSPSLEYLNLRKSLRVAETVMNSLDPLLVSQYDVSKFDVKLSKLLLSQNAFYLNENNVLHPVTFQSEESEELVYQPLPGKWVIVPKIELTIALCRDCYAGTRSKSQHMPAEAIANGNWIGRLPAKFGDVSRTTENVVSLMQPCIYLSSIFGHGSDSNTRNINSHHYILKNNAPVLCSVPASIGSTFRFTFVGAWTPLEIAEQKTRYKCQDFVYELLEFFEAHHSGYKEHNYLVNKRHQENASQEELDAEVFVDRSFSSETAVNEKICRLLNHTTYNTGSAASSSNEDTIHYVFSPSTNTSMSAPQPDIPDSTAAAAAALQPQPDLVDGPQDYAVFRSSTFSNARGFSEFPLYFPCLVPFGRGGPNEQRSVPLSEDRWIKRIYRLHGGKAARHWGCVGVTHDRTSSLSVNATTEVSCCGGVVDP
ncbi:hypothetical protein BDR26DRAFT_896345 [Obelidium mucronatum]|nr:hypothetical protein BDR26DRAFT_896345 [Obelidium mucronatum]